jgi:site-specific DNA-cytosine methylase
MWFVKARRAQNKDDFETWVAGGVSTTLNAFDNATETRATVIVMREREGKPGGGKGPLLSDRSFTLSTANFQTIFAYSIREDAKAGNFSATETDTALTLQSYQPSVQAHHAQLFIADAPSVRRLTPTECERLQGFPDGWTDNQLDSHRYKQLGNAVAVPVVQWIIDRI